jgi:tetratricopeptide (TPR) repeat protein
MTISRKSIVLMVLALAVAAAAAWWVLVNPDNPLTTLFRRRISDVNARIIIGPYPAERDFRLLKQNRVGLVVSLLDPAIPYEATLLARERDIAAKYGLLLKNFPMSSILGSRFGNYYDTSAAAAAAAIAASPEKTYLHCYLGMHRIQAVRNELAARGIVAGTYAVREGERDEPAALLDMAEAAFNGRKYQTAIETIGKIDETRLTDDARLLRAWSHYRLGNIKEARALFEASKRLSPGNPQASLGLAYCAYRQDDYADAERLFLAVIRQLPEDADALGGLGLTYYRANRYAEAESRLEAALKLAPDNQEVREVLARVRDMKDKG